MGTTKTATARALIDPEVKKEAESILKELGLSISNSIINDHDGTLTFSSSPSGTTFVIRIPANRTHKINEVQKHV